MGNTRNLCLVESSKIPNGKECTLDAPLMYNLATVMEAICTKENGIGLSAVQVGVPLNFFIIKFQESFRYFANCQYTAMDDDKEKSIEGCLSLKTRSGELRWFEVSRFKNVTISGKELVVEPQLTFVDFTITPQDYMKIVFQHEIDHQNGILISNIGKEVIIF